MRKALLLLLTFICITFGVKAQDIITLTNGTQIQAKVLEINPGDIKYKDFNNQDGPTITVLKASVASIVYANGAKTVFNESTDVKPGSGHFTRGNNTTTYNSDKDRGAYRKKSERNSRIHGWYFGVGFDLGSGTPTSSDPTYSISGGARFAINFLATKMFNQHIGIQFGIGDEAYSYNVDFYNSGSDMFNLTYLTLPVRVLYFSNSKKRVGFYGMAGFDMSILNSAQEQNQGAPLSAYYNPIIFSPYLSCGVEFRNRTARGVWMFGPYFKTSLSNIYSGNSDSNGNLYTGNTGSIPSFGLSIVYMTKFGRGR